MYVYSYLYGFFILKVTLYFIVICICICSRICMGCELIEYTHIVHFIDESRTQSDWNYDHVANSSKKNRERESWKLEHTRHLEKRKIEEQRNWICAHGFRLGIFRVRSKSIGSHWQQTLDSNQMEIKLFVCLAKKFIFHTML